MQPTPFYRNLPDPSLPLCLCPFPLNWSAFLVCVMRTFSSNPSTAPRETVLERPCWLALALMRRGNDLNPRWKPRRGQAGPAASPRRCGPGHIPEQVEANLAQNQHPGTLPGPRHRKCTRSELSENLGGGLAACRLLSTPSQRERSCLALRPHRLGLRFTQAAAPANSSCLPSPSGSPSWPPRRVLEPAMRPKLSSLRWLS
nr:uncharacterized protein LOC103351668 isoform X2 [Oryctolagus cuniculus]